MIRRITAQQNKSESLAIEPGKRGILQRTNACGRSIAASVECAECRKKESGLQCHTVKLNYPSTTSLNEHEVLRSSEQPLDRATNTTTKTRFDKDFSRVPVQGDMSPSAKHYTSKDPSRTLLAIAASPEESSLPMPTGTGSPVVSHPRPFTAVGTFAMREVESCHVPTGHHGLSKAVRFGVRDFHGHPVRSPLTIGERFTRLEGSEEIFRRLRPVTYRSAAGRFDDCYRLYQPSHLPRGLRLKVGQNHIVDGEIISKNHVTFTPNNILVCIFRRPPRRRDFASRCRTF